MPIFLFLLVPRELRKIFLDFALKHFLHYVFFCRGSIVSANTVLFNSEHLYSVRSRDEVFLSSSSYHHLESIKNWTWWTGKQHWTCNNIWWLNIFLVLLRFMWWLEKMSLLIRHFIKLVRQGYFTMGKVYSICSNHFSKQNRKIQIFYTILAVYCNHIEMHDVRRILHLPI